jgi:ABC-type dipeptide/oligopeptide/nickel transport system permease subunit
VNVLPQVLDLIHVPANILIVFVSVVFVNSPTVFSIVRGLVLDIKTRDYVSAAQTRGERPWYIMLWEILPNARGPLIVDFCLRIGYTTILLGTLGFFGLGLSPESPDWGSTINAGPQAPDHRPLPGPRSGAGADEPCAWPEPSGRWSARRKPQGLMMGRPAPIFCL